LNFLAWPKTTGAFKPTAPKARVAAADFKNLRLLIFPPTFSLLMILPPFKDD
jgi:hypothetical protein